MRQYEGSRAKAGTVVTVNGDIIDPRLDLRNHSPSGLEWGYAGSGPAQLALAILADHYKEKKKALEVYQSFKFAVVTKLPKYGWTLTTEQINEVMQSLGGE